MSLPQLPDPRSPSPPPRYARIAATLRREIVAGMRPGDALPTEPRLEQRFGVSRITVRRALDELVAEGLILRRQGSGTYVREPRLTQDLSRLTSWMVAIRQLGFEPQTASTAIDVLEPSHDLRAKLCLGEGERVVRVHRVQHASGEPLCLMTNYVQLGLIPGLERDGLVDGSLYATLLAHGLRPVRAEDTVEARPAAEGEAAQLGIAPWSPLLQVTRVSYDAGGHPLDAAVVANRGDKFRYSVCFGNG